MIQPQDHLNHLDSANRSSSQQHTGARRPFLARVTAQANQDDHLPIEQNDVVSIEECLGEQWYMAKSDQSRGKISKTNCQILDQDIPLSLCQYLIDNSYYDLYVCFASFVAQDVGDLSITKGDVIVANKQVNEHWMQGQVCFDGQIYKWPHLIALQQVGTFPLNHCWLLDSERVKAFCHDKICQQQQQQTIHSNNYSQHPPAKLPNFILNAHSASLSSGSSSLHSSSDNQHQNQFSNPPPRPQHLPRPIPQKSNTKQHLSTNDLPHNSVVQSILTSRQQDKLKGWFNTVRKKTTRITTRITASLGLISLTRDEEFEKHYEQFKHIEKTIKQLIKNLNSFVEHFETFLLALQNTTENIGKFYRDKSHSKEIELLRKKNKALNCEHFHAFKRTIDRQVVAISNQLLQRFATPQQLINKRSAKLLDYDTKAKEMESCRDLEKKNNLREQYVISKDLYETINRQLINELPLFNQLAVDILRECVLVLLDSRKKLIESYTEQISGLLNTPLMLTYTASNVASSIMMSCEFAKTNNNFNELLMERSLRKDSVQTSGHGTSRHNSVTDNDQQNNQSFRPHSSASQLSSEFDHMNIAPPRDISSTPLSNVSYAENNEDNNIREQSISRIEPNGHTSDQIIELNNNTKFPDEAAQTNQNHPETPTVPDVAQRDGDGYDEVEGIIEPKTSINVESIKNQNVQTTDDGFESVRSKNEQPKKEDIKRRKRKFQIYVASWPFVATGPNQLTIACKQPLKLIKDCDECGNPDWSLVQDKKGQLGYVPSSYIKKKE